MPSLTLLKKSSTFVPNKSSYQMELEVLSTEGMDKNVFVKQRIGNPLIQDFEDVFVAIATPEQMASFNVQSPSQDTSFFRDSTITIIFRTPEFGESVVKTIISELQNLVTDVTYLPELEVDGIYTITPDSIHINMAELHRHFRIPLFTKPAGTISNNGEIYTFDTVDNSLAGWLPTSKTGFAFVYNIATDTTLASLFPPSNDKIGYAHVEINGSNTTDAVITSEGIYWKQNVYNLAPWNKDYEDTDNTGDPDYNIHLLLDFIV